MNQSVNLYDHLDHAQTLRFSAVHGVSASIGLLGAMLLIGVYLAVTTQLNAGQLAKTKEQRIQLQQELAVLQANAAGSDSEISLQQLRDQVLQKRRVLASVGELPRNAFSTYMEGLGRQHIKGLWLDRLQVKNRGEQIAIHGAMNQASLLPRYLQQLSNEPAFQGLRFQLMRIEEQPEKAQQMHFEIAVLADAVSADAKSAGNRGGGES